LLTNPYVNDEGSEKVDKAAAGVGGDEDLDGKSLSEDDDVDGVPLDGAALLKRGE